MRIDIHFLYRHDFLDEVLYHNILVYLDANMYGLVISELRVVALEEAAVGMLALLVFQVVAIHATFEGVLCYAESRILYYVLYFVWQSVDDYV